MSFPPNLLDATQADTNWLIVGEVREGFGSEMLLSHLLQVAPHLLCSLLASGPMTDSANQMPEQVNAAFK